MKVTFDTETGECKVGKKVYGTTLPIYKQDEINAFLRKFLNENTKLHRTSYNSCAYACC